MPLVADANAATVLYVLVFVLALVANPYKLYPLTLELNVKLLVPVFVVAITVVYAVPVP